MKFRFIKCAEHSATMNMALDEAIYESVRDKKSLPTIRLYTWNPSAVSIGYFQGISYEVNKEACKKKKVDIVRRRTGGGAVYHDKEGEITYSIITPIDTFSKDIIKSYEEICSHLISALSMLGIKAVFSPINDITVNEKKISGSAQLRKEGVLMQHGTLLLNVNVEKMFSLLKVGKIKVSDKLIASVKKRVTSIKDEQVKKTTSKEKVINALEKSFCAGKEIVQGKYSQEEIKRANVLLKEKYANNKWTNMREHFSES